MREEIPEVFTDFGGNSWDSDKPKTKADKSPVEKFVAEAIAAVEQMQELRLELDGYEYCDTQHYKNTQHAIELLSIFNRSFELNLETDQQSDRLETLNKLVRNLTAYRNQEFLFRELATADNEKEKVQRVINLIRDWVFARKGKLFQIQEIYLDPNLSEHLPVNLETIVMLRKALLVLRCVAAPDSLVTYIPPMINRVNRDDFYS
ncbi:hypothetical protein C7H79_11150 [Nitrosomonas supralitoralis]|uniref:Uncharacterized protein n=2 Tax=Nitrosomonas supralitoralis TaxID=2116706 RepID=A0A2P7NTW2_9PROT|nr:hypothetical protein C7H79_11150 [Nitrosomonas supralitoralis]